jgi:hypothetical protein
MHSLVVMDGLQASLYDVAQAPSSKLPGFLSEIRPLFMYAYSADPNSGEILVGPRHSVETLTPYMTLPVIQEYAPPFKRALEIHIPLYDAFPINQLRQLGLLVSAQDVEAEAERKTYVVGFPSRSDAGHD